MHDGVRTVREEHAPPGHQRKRLFLRVRTVGHHGRRLTEQPEPVPDPRVGSLLRKAFSHRRRIKWVLVHVGLHREAVPLREAAERIEQSLRAGRYIFRAQNAADPILPFERADQRLRPLQGRLRCLRGLTVFAEVAVHLTDEGFESSAPEMADEIQCRREVRSRHHHRVERAVPEKLIRERRVDSLRVLRLRVGLLRRMAVQPEPLLSGPVAAESGHRKLGGMQVEIRKGRDHQRVPELDRLRTSLRIRLLRPDRPDTAGCIHAHIRRIHNL